MKSMKLMVVAFGQPGYMPDGLSLVIVRGDEDPESLFAEIVEAEPDRYDDAGESVYYSVTYSVFGLAEAISLGVATRDEILDLLY